MVVVVIEMDRVGRIAFKGQVATARRAENPQLELEPGTRPCQGSAFGSLLVAGAFVTAGVALNCRGLPRLPTLSLTRGCDFNVANEWPLGHDLE